MTRVPKQAEDAAKRLGIGFICDKGQPLWTGCAINLAYVFNDPVYSPTNVIVHELAHYVVAPRKYRHSPNFGWEDTPSGPRATKRREGKDVEERRAQVLTYLTLRAFGLPWEKQAATDFWTPEKLLKAARRLVARGLVEPGTLRPKFLGGAAS